MGLIVDIYRSDMADCSNGGVSGRVKSLTLVNVDGPFEPDERRPAARLVHRSLGGRDVYHVEPEDRPDGCVGPMMGGCYVATSDSRFGRATGQYGAIALHDRFETPRRGATWDRETGDVS